MAAKEHRPQHAEQHHRAPRTDRPCPIRMRVGSLHCSWPTGDDVGAEEHRASTTRSCCRRRDLVSGDLDRAGSRLASAARPPNLTRRRPDRVYARLMSLFSPLSCLFFTRAILLRQGPILLRVGPVARAFQLDLVLRHL
jgi:hypothetical protein